MKTVKDIMSAIEEVAPLVLQESYDNAGLQCGDPRQEVRRVLCCLDITEAVVEEAHALGCELVVSHHPLIFGGINRIDPTHDYVSRTLMLAIRYGIALYSAHTNLDKAQGGVNHRLAEVLELQQVEPMSECGVVGNLPVPMTPSELIGMVCEKLGIEGLNSNEAFLTSHTDVVSMKLCRLALCGGSGAEFIAEARQMGADAFLTGEIRYHSYFGQEEILLLEAGHYETEQFTIGLLCDIVGKTSVEAIATSVNTNPRIRF